MPALLTDVVRNSQARALTQTRNLAVANLVWSLRRLNRLDDARRWCSVAREWQVAEVRIAAFCGEPLTAFTDRDVLFPVAPGCSPTKTSKPLCHASTSSFWTSTKTSAAFR